MTSRALSLPKQVALAGGFEAWHDAHPQLSTLRAMLDAVCTAQTPDEALSQVKSMIALGNHLWAYMYMRMLAYKNIDLCYATVLADPAALLPVVYTPTVGEACQKFGLMPQYPRGCYVSIADRGNIKAVLQDYAEAHLARDADRQPICDCIVFSDGGRILGLGDLGAWGMGIPIGKLDLYTVCGGVNPHRTMPVLIDAGCQDKDKNTAKLTIRDHSLYTGEKQERVMKVSHNSTLVNVAYYGKNNMIDEFMGAARDLFGPHCLLQFEDFTSNDAFLLLEEYRNKYLCYNDDIQGTAGVTVAGILGAIKLKNPAETDLIGALKKETFLFHGAGAANIGTISLLRDEGGVPMSRLHITNSRGIIWKSADGTEGSWRNDQQKEFACVGQLDFDMKDLVSIITNLQPSCVIGAVGVVPNCFTKEVIEAVLAARQHEAERPIVFALSNPRTQAEITAKDAYTWSQGEIIYGSGTQFETVEINGRTHYPGQVNNVYIFPGMSFGAICCKAKYIPERFFMVAAEAVANSLDDADLEADRVVPHRDRLREVGLNVATAVAGEAQKMGLAENPLGEKWDEVQAALKAMMWSPAL